MTSTADRTACTTAIVTTSGMPVGRCPSHGTSVHHVGKHGWDGEAREVQHAVHGVILQVEATRGSSRLLAVGRREVAIGVGIGPGRRNVCRVDDIGIDQGDLVESQYSSIQFKGVKENSPLP